MSKRLASKVDATEAVAIARYVPISAQKARLVADLVRGKKAQDALNLLRFTPKVEPVSKAIASAMANAVENKQMSVDSLMVSRIFVDEAPHMAAFCRARAVSPAHSPQLSHQRHCGRGDLTGRKVHPYGFRLGIIRDWKSRWFAPKKEYTKLLSEDFKLRRYLAKELEKAGVGEIIIERFPPNQLHVTVHTARTWRCDWAQRRGC